MKRRLLYRKAKENIKEEREIFRKEKEIHFERMKEDEGIFWKEEKNMLKESLKKSYIFKEFFLVSEV